jgi:hypothetical protein
MARYLVFALLLLAATVPAPGKPRNDAYPVTCADLWNAVSDTLGNAGNYKILASDDSELKAYSLAVGSQRQRVNSVSLNPKDNGCELLTQFPDSGFANDDEGAFRKRLAHSVAKLQAAKPQQPGKADEKK